MGEYLALAVSLEDLGAKTNNARATLLGNTLNAAIGKLLDNRKSPSIKVKEIDNRGSNFYIAQYWAEEMAKHDASFKTLAANLKSNEAAITKVKKKDENCSACFSLGRNCFSCAAASHIFRN